MKITDVSINLRTAVMVLTAGIFVAGMVAYVRLPKESAPSIEVPNIIVTTLYPGASPRDVENLITRPIEQELQGINGVDEIRSTSTEGVSTIVVEFTPDISMDEANQRVREKVDLAKPELPSDAEEPILAEIDFSEFPIMVVNLASAYPLTQLNRVAEDLEDQLEAIPSVLEVDRVGGPEREVQVNVELGRLQGYNLTFQDLVDAITRENANIPGGSIDVDRLNYLVRVDGRFQTPEEIETLVIKAPGGRAIYVRDVATAHLGFKDRETYARLRVLQRDETGKLVRIDDPAYRQVISLNIKKRSGKNILDTAKAVRGVLDNYDFPPGTEVLITGDESKNVRILVLDLENNIISGLIFVVAVLLFFLGVRNAVLVGIAIPLSMFTTFLVFSVMGQTLNFIILFSLIIALGMLVDNAIVIVENIYRYLEEGYGHFEAARLGTREVGMPVVASTATTVVAFAPMLAWPGVMGEFMGYMPLTLIITLLCSLFVALVINPVVTGYFALAPHHHRHRVSPWPRRLAILGGLFVVALIGLLNPITLGVLAGGGVALLAIHLLFFKRIGDYFVERGLPRLTSWYRGFLNSMLVRDYTPRWAMFRNTFALGAFSVGVLLCIGGGLLFAALGRGPGLLLLAPGGLLFALGLVGIIVHSLEVVALGRWASVKFGLGFGAVMGGLLALIYVSPRPLDVPTMARLMMLPGAILAIGFLGALIFRRRRRLILTDNRAKLLNATLGALFAIAAMYGVAPTGVAFFPDTDPNQIQVAIEGPLGTNIETSNALAQSVHQRIDALLAESPETRANVKNVLVNVGVGGDAMFGGGARRVEKSQVTLNLVDFEDRIEPSSVTMTRLRSQLEGVAGADIELKRDQAGPPTGPPVNIEVSGPDFAEIVRITRVLKARIQGAVDAGRIKGLVDLRDNLNAGRPEMLIRIDRERAALFGLDTTKIATLVRSAIFGVEAGTWRTGEDEYDIVVRLRPEDRAQLESVEGLTVLHEGKQIPLVSVAEPELTTGLGSITRLDLNRVVTVQANAATGVNAQALLGMVQAELAPLEKTLPRGYTMRFTGENEEMQESFSFLGTALAIGVAAIAIILIAQFNSLLLPFIIMVAVALSMIGVLLGLIVTRTPYGLFSFIGVISLAGIVVNNNIVLVDYALQLRQRGKTKREAIIESGATRLRPVLLTALTTVLGLIPLTFGINIDFVGLLTRLEPNFQIGSANTQFWGPMGTTIISGLSFATFLTLVIVPTMYSVFDSIAERARRAMRQEETVDGDEAAKREAEVEALSQ